MGWTFTVTIQAPDEATANWYMEAMIERASELGGMYVPGRLGDTSVMLDAGDQPRRGERPPRPSADVLKFPRLARPREVTEQ
jgi:hypothetical protein